jgi:hypothetical protein
LDLRNSIHVTGGGFVIAAVTASAGCAQHMPAVAIEEWRGTGNETDVRRWMLGDANLAPHSLSLQSWPVDLRTPYEILQHCDLDRLLPETDLFSRPIMMSHGMFLGLLDFLPHIGFDKVATIAHKAHHEGTTRREAALTLVQRCARRVRRLGAARDSDRTAIGLKPQHHGLLPTSRGAIGSHWQRWTSVPHRRAQALLQLAPRLPARAPPAAPVARSLLAGAYCNHSDGRRSVRQCRLWRAVVPASATCSGKKLRIVE